MLKVDLEIKHRAMFLCGLHQNQRIRIVFIGQVSLHIQGNIIASLSETSELLFIVYSKCSNHDLWAVAAPEKILRRDNFFDND